MIADRDHHLSVLQKPEVLHKSPCSHLVGPMKVMVIDLRLVAEKLPLILLYQHDHQPKALIHRKHEMGDSGLLMEEGGRHSDHRGNLHPRHHGHESKHTCCLQQREASRVMQRVESDPYISKSPTMEFTITRLCFTSSLWQEAFHINPSPPRITRMQFSPTPSQQEFESPVWFDRSGSSGLRQL